MAILIKWSDEAVKTFDLNIEFLMKEWSENDIRSFIRQTNAKIKSIESNPKLYRRLEKKPKSGELELIKMLPCFINMQPLKKK